MEPRFGHDFSQVRVHADARAADSARALNALAYTVGQDTVFGAGRYAPGTAEGRRLLAHELAHVLQQAEGSAAGAVRISDPRDPAEHDAGRAARNAIAGQKAQVVTAATAGTLYRQPLPDVTLRSSPRIARLIGSELLDDFALESYALSEDHKKRLANLTQTLLDLLREYPGGSIRITGHTDVTGSDEFNDRLGQKRADAVMDFLIEAGVPATALVAVSAGESELRVETKGPEPRNRRVEVRFEPEARGRFLPAPKLTPPRHPSEEERPKPSLFTLREPDAPTDCGSTTDCSAVSVDRFDNQPAALRGLIKRSFNDPEGWFGRLSPELRLALTSIFNRLCQYGLLCHVHLIVRPDAGEAPAVVLDRRFNVPGSTPSVYFISPSGGALFDALMATGRFCMAFGAGATLHPKQTTLREISGSDSLHISIGPGNQLDAHIDRYSAVPEHPGSSFCSNEPSPAAVGHIGREVVPEMVRKILGLPGLEAFPEPPPQAPVPPGTVGSETLPEVVRITLRGPVKERQRQKSDVALLPPNIEQRLAAEIPKRIRRNALVPPGAKRELAAAVRAADYAGPDEEDALVAAREAARERLGSFADDAHYFAQNMARKMDQARRSGRPDFAVQLGPVYGELTPDNRKYVLAQIRDIARIVRALLAERAAGVHKIWVAFGESVIWNVEF
jgi:outer membrane protein OmpA-like peptidoglycan-associated protein